MFRPETFRRLYVLGNDGVKFPQSQARCLRPF